MDRKTIVSLSTLIAFVGVLHAPVFAKTSWFHPIELLQKKQTFNVPKKYNSPQLPDVDSPNSAASISWRRFFSDPYLIALIEKALANNQEFNIAIQDIQIAANEVKERQSEYLPKVGLGAGGSYIHPSENTPEGVLDTLTEREFYRYPDYNLNLGPSLSWEVDIWKKLRTEKTAAVTRYLATIEGKNFVITNLIAEIADAYYELLSLDNQLEIVRQTIGLQKNALEIVRVQKDAARVTELAVKKFEAEVLGSQSMEFDLLQKIKEKENEINFLVGRYPQPVVRDKSAFMSLMPQQVSAGIPSQLLKNRPDIKQAELELTAAELDVKVARAEFLPSFEISSAIGINAFKPSYLVKFPESVLFSLAGDLAGPLINKNAIKAEFANANARQLQALYNYERTILNAYVEVSTGLSGLDNLQKAYDVKTKEVNALVNSVDIANDLFKSARADYFEVLMTQRDALESKLELTETKLRQFNAVVNIYRSLGGGWN